MQRLYLFTVCAASRLDEPIGIACFRGRAAVPESETVSPNYQSFEEDVCAHAHVEIDNVAGELDQHVPIGAVKRWSWN
jgi:hypothetical protein